MARADESGTSQPGAGKRAGARSGPGYTAPPLVPPDRELMARIALREERALTTLYDRHRSAVFGICARVLGAGPDAEDILEEVFIEVWQRPERYDASRSAPLSYLAVMARSRSIDRIRSKTRRADAYDRHRALEPPTDDKDAFDTAHATEQRKRARAAMELLQPNEREIIDLFYWRGLTHAEISAELALPLGTVKTRIRRGLLRLREHLVPAPLEPDTDPEPEATT